MLIRSYDNHTPTIHPDARAAENVVLVGQVTLKAGASVWYGAAIRADDAPIVVGEGSNIQENSVCHCDEGLPVIVGKDVTVGHGAILHSCVIEDGALIGMGAILLNGSVVGAGSIVGAGALVTQNTVIPPGSLAVGSPAKVVRSLRPEEREELLHSAEHYRIRARELLPTAAGESAV